MNPIRHRTTRVDVTLAMRRRAVLYAWPRLAVASARAEPGTTSQRGLSAFLLPFVAAVVATLLTLGLLGLLFDTNDMPATQQQTHASADLTRVTG